MTDLEVFNYCNRIAQFFHTLALTTAGAIVPGTLSKTTQLLTSYSFWIKSGAKVACTHYPNNTINIHHHRFGSNVDQIIRI